MQGFGRTVRRDVEIDDVRIEAGSQVLLLYGSVNRDERHYPEPDRFDVTRNPADHLSFGCGTHSWAGQAHARIEAQSVIAALAKRVRRFALGEPTRHLNNVVRGLAHLPVNGLGLR